jgi:subtilisin
VSGLIDQDVLQSAIDTGTGNGVRIALLDTGVDEDHPELAGRIAASYELVRSGGGYSCVSAKGTDEVGHGTACAGIIKRLAPEVELHSIKVIGSNARGSSDELAQGIKWAIENKMNVVSASLGTLDRRSREKISDLADEAFYNGIVVVAAANNRGQTAYPANLSSVLAVDSDAMDEALSIRYRLKTPIELVANGIYVEAPSPGGGTKFYTGTSFACPHASAMVARILSVHPELQPFEVRTMLLRISAK